MRICKVEGCGRIHEAKGYCNAHNKQRLKHGKIVNIKIKHVDPDRGCKVDGCSGKHSAGGYCIRHYDQMRRRGKVINHARKDPNEIIINGDIAEICLYNADGEEIAQSTINAEDVGKIEKYKWYLSFYKYAQAWIEGHHVRMQHIVMMVQPNIKTHIDHIDGNPLRHITKRL